MSNNNKTFVYPPSSPASGREQNFISEFKKIFSGMALKINDISQQINVINFRLNAIERSRSKRSNKTGTSISPPCFKIVQEVPTEEFSFGDVYPPTKSLDVTVINKEIITDQIKYNTTVQADPYVENYLIESINDKNKTAKQTGKSMEDVFEFKNSSTKGLTPLVKFVASIKVIFESPDDLCFLVGSFSVQKNREGIGQKSEFLLYSKLSLERNTLWFIKAICMYF